MSEDPSTSKAARINILSYEDNAMVMKNEYSEDTSLWSIEDDTIFYAQGLVNRSAGKRKIVFVTWNENYILNFVFKTSSATRKTSLTKVRLTMPIHKQELEEVENILILEMNSLVYMKSGLVYYFTSVKSIHRVEWLTGVRCMTSGPHMQFSVIRLISNSEGRQTTKQLYLQVYQDSQLLGKCDGMDILRHSYDISFDLENIFNCDWLDERYTLFSVITCEENLEFLKLLLAIGNIFRPKQDKIEVVNNQEVHIFTISGNIFILIGAIVSENVSGRYKVEDVEDYSIRLLNTYASNIECIRVDFKKSIFIVVLQSGHIDVWYISKRMFGSIQHHQHQIPSFLHYDYRPKNNTLYFTTIDDVIELKIIQLNDDNTEEECVVHEVRKAICGMIACTWVEHLQQLICLSFNNIFYRLCFEKINQLQEKKGNESKYENFNKIYALTERRVEDLMGRAKIVKELLKQPELLHQQIEEEFQKQEIIALGSKHELLQKMYHSHIEYHINMPETNYFLKDCLQIRTKFNSSHAQEYNSVYCLVFLTLKKKNEFLSNIINTPQWYLHISDNQQSLLLHVPSHILHQNICLILNYSLANNTNKMLPELYLNMLTFVNHCSSYICLNLKISLDKNECTYRNIFSHNIRNLPLFRSSECDIKTLLKEFNNSKNNIDCNEKLFRGKHCFLISKQVIKNIFLRLHIETLDTYNTAFKIYFLYQHEIDLQYDENTQVLSICSKYPAAIFYIKLFLFYESKSNNDVKLVSNTKHMQQMIMQYQCEVERLYGSLTSSDCMDVDSDTTCMHLENLRKVYVKLRTEFNEIFN